MSFKKGRWAAFFALVVTAGFVAGAVLTRWNTNFCAGFGMLAAAMLVLCLCICQKYCACPQCKKFTLKNVFTGGRCPSCGAEVKSSPGEAGSGRRLGKR